MEEPSGLPGRALARFTRWWTTVRGWNESAIPKGLFDKQNKQMRVGRTAPFSSDHPLSTTVPNTLSGYFLKRHCGRTLGRRGRSHNTGRRAHVHAHTKGEGEGYTAGQEAPVPAAAPARRGSSHACKRVTKLLTTLSVSSTSFTLRRSIASC